MHATARLVLISCALLGFGMWHGAAGAEPGLDGYWIDSDGEVVLEVAPCGSARCAKVAWLKQPYGPDGAPLRDYKNSDPKLATRPVCGLEIISGFEKQSDGTWGGAKVYVPDAGMSFNGKAEVISPAQIKVTGFVVLPIFGSSEVWTRVQGPPAKCAAAASGAAVPEANAAPASKPQR